MRSTDKHTKHCLLVHLLWSLFATILSWWLLYSHMLQLYTYTCIIQIDAMNNDERLFFKKYTSHFICKVAKRLLKVLLSEGVGDWTELQYIDSHSYGHQRCVFLVLLGCSTGGLGAQPLRGIFSPTGLVSKTQSGVPTAPSVGGGFLYHILSLTPLISNSLTSCLHRVT